MAKKKNRLLFVMSCIRKSARIVALPKMDIHALGGFFVGNIRPCNKGGFCDQHSLFSLTLGVLGIS